MDWKQALVRGLDLTCQAVDDVAYRPAVVWLAQPLPRWWRCELAQLSLWLDNRWKVSYWHGHDERTLAPGGLCAICQRRPANLEIGGSWDDLDLQSDGSYMEAHPLRVCFWCKLPVGPIESDEQLASAIADARARSISWRWR